MQEKLFSFLTIRHIHKSKTRPAKPAIEVTSHILGYIVDARRPIADRVKYLNDQWKVFESRSLASLSPKIALLVTEFREAKFRLTPQNLYATVQRVFGRDFNYIMANSTYKYQFTLVRNAFVLAVIKRPEGPSLELTDAVRVIHVLEAVRANKISTATQTAAVWETRLELDEKVPAFLMESQEVAAPPQAPSLPTPDREEKARQLQTRLGKIERALRDTKTRHTHEVKPVLLERDREDKTKLLQTDVQIQFSDTKAASFSKETNDIIKEAGHDLQALTVDGVRNSLKQLQLSTISELADNTVPATVQKALIDGKLVTIDALLQPPALAVNLPMLGEPNEYVKPLGIGELKTVEQVNVYYEAGEIAHVENILKGEHKVREHQQETLTKQVDDVETQRTESSENQLETTQRHELASETRKVVNEASAFDFSLHTDSDFGPYLEVQTDTSYETASSKEKSKETSSNFARETVEKAAQRIQESVRERRVSTKSRKVNELNRHELNNVEGEGHVVGVYRWLNKKYDARVRTHGFRSMYEFTIPEPAAFHLFAESRNLDSQFILEEPLPPNFSPFGGPFNPLRPEHLNESTYLLYSAKYNVPSMSPPPVEEIVLSQTISEMVVKQDNAYRLVKALNYDIPKGYLPTLVIGSGNLLHGTGRTMGVVASIGKINIFGQGLAITPEFQDNNFTLLGNPGLHDTPGGLPSVETRKFPISLAIYDALGVSMTLMVRCTRTQEAYRRWQIETYEQIMAAYREMKAEYDEKLRGLQYSRGIVIGGNSPLENKKIQETELKKHCLSYMTRTRLDNFNHMYEQQITTATGQTLNYPEIDFERMRLNTAKIQFLENAFEWSRMMYQFYPYFWSDKANWLSKRAHSSADPQFREFLRAGAARVVLAVREGYEDAVAYFMQTGFIPEGSTSVTFGNSLFVDVVDLLKEEQATSQGEIIDEWKVTLPTNLVVLDDPDAIAQISRVFNEAEA